MTSTLDSYLGWAGVHGHARAMLNHLTALTAKVELLGENPAIQRGRAHGAVEEIRAELAVAALAAKAIAAETARRIPTPGVADLAEIVLDTVGPMERYLRAREVVYSLPRIPAGRRVAVEPELLRATIAAAVDVVLGPALPSERLELSYEARSLGHLLRITLEMRSAPPDVSAAEAKLLPLRAWLELRGGSVEVRVAPSSFSIEMDLPAAREDRC